MNIRKNFALLLTIAMILSLVACSTPIGGGTGPSNADGNALSGSDAETRIVVDVWGREIEIPAKVESIVCLGSGAPRIAAYLNVMDMLVGAEEIDTKSFTPTRDYNPIYHDTFKELPIVGSGGGSGNNNGYPEELITLAPDVILAAFSHEAADELYTQTGIPVVSVRYISTGLANDTFYDAMRVFADTVGAQQRCEEILSFIDACKKDLDSRTLNIPDTDKLKAYTGAVTFNGKHGFAGTYSDFGPFAVINALNVADEVSQEGFYEVDLEKILVWDPDVIFLDPGNMSLVNDEYATKPDYFNSVRAVQEGQVYTMPAFNSAGTNITYALMDAYYAGTILFPEQFADIDMAEKSGEILNMFLGRNIYDAMAEGGLYYGKIIIGE